MYGVIHLSYKSWYSFKVNLSSAKQFILALSLFDDYFSFEMKRSEILLSAQRALLGSVTGNMNAVTIGYSEYSLVLKGYFYKEPSGYELELLSIISTEIIADFPSMMKCEEQFSIACDGNLEMLDEWIFLRDQNH